MDISNQRAEPPRLKACDTCFRAKIRCDGTQNSGSCDRCLRLDKECYFAPARRRNPPRSRTRVLEAKTDQSGQSRTRSPNTAISDVLHGDMPHLTDETTSPHHDPVADGSLTETRAQAILDIYKDRMAPHFPFVILPSFASAEVIRIERPYLFLAVIAVARYGDSGLQKKTSHSFNKLVAATLTRGSPSSLDLLQGLLVYLAWAHYQPQPRMYSRHLHIATSIVSDMRLDRPKNPNLWNVGKPSGEQAKQPPWSSEALRALIGTYYLASSSSTILQKLRHFPYSDFILESSLQLNATGEYPTDMYLLHIVRLQKLSEDLGDILAYSPHVSSIDDINEKITKIQADLGLFKSMHSFPLSDCSTLLLQLSSLELIISQISLRGFPFGLDTFQRRIPDGRQLIDCLAEAVSASKSLVGFLLNMTPGEEFAITNLAWIMLSCGMSLAVRLDILARGPRVAHLTPHLLRLLDIRHSLRQITLRLEAAAAASSANETDQPRTFEQFLRRLQTIELWHQRQMDVSDISNPSTASNVNTLSSFRTASRDHDNTSQPYGIDTRGNLVGPDPDGLTLGDMHNFQDFSVLELSAQDDEQALDFNPVWPFYIFSPQLL